MKRWFFVSLIVLALSAVILAGCASPAPAPATSPTAAKKPVEIRLVSHQPNVYPNNTFDRFFLEKVEAKAKGEVVIKFVGGPEAIPITDQAVAVQKGNIDMANVITSFASTLAPGVISLSASEINYVDVRKSGAFDYAQTLFNKAGMYFLGFSYPIPPQTGFQWYLNKKVEKVDDFKGLKLACPSPTYVPFATALGSNPVIVGIMDYYTAMERGTVDGYTYASVGVAKTLEKVTKYQLTDSFGSSSAVYVVNMDVWNKLPKNVQNILKEAALEVDTEGPAKWTVVEKELRDIMEKNGMQFVSLPPAEAKKFHDIYKQATWAKYTEQFPEVAPKFKAMIAKD